MGGFLVGEGWDARTGGGWGEEVGNVGYENGVAPRLLVQAAHNTLK